MGWGGVVEGGSGRRIQGPICSVALDPGETGAGTGPGGGIRESAGERVHRPRLPTGTQGLHDLQNCVLEPMRLAQLAHLSQQAVSLYKQKWKYDLERCHKGLQPFNNSTVSFLKFTGMFKGKHLFYTRNICMNSAIL